MSRLAEKLKRVAAGSKGLSKSIEAQADELLAKQEELLQRTNDAMGRHNAITQDAAAGVAEIEAALNEFNE